jgi:PhzF family phenazine biosynthesis protein
MSTRIPIFHVDAFAARRFTGNPAAVLLMDAFAPDGVLQAIAAEKNLPATAFIVKCGDEYRLRWYSPTTELPLCGHGTLASAAVIMERLEPARRRVTFQSASGPLTVSRLDSRYVVDLPARRLEPIAMPRRLSDALTVVPVAVFADALSYLVDAERTGGP